MDYEKLKEARRLFLESENQMELKEGEVIWGPEEAIDALIKEVFKNPTHNESQTHQNDRKTRV